VTPRAGARSSVPGALALAAFALLCAGAGGKQELPLRLAGGLLFGLTAFWAASGRLDRALGHPVGPPALAFLLLGAVSAVFSPDKHAALTGYLHWAAAVAFGASAAALWDDRHRRFFAGAVLALGAAQAAAVLAASVLGREVPRWIPGNPQHAAFWLLAAAWLAWPRAFDASPPARRVGNAALAVALTASALLLPVRSAAAGLAVGGAWFLGRRWGWRALVAGAAFALIAAAAAPASLRGRFLKTGDPDSWRRTLLWETAARGILERPFLGWGPGQFESLYLRHAPALPDRPVRYGVTTAFAHCDLLQFAAEAGLPAAGLILWGTLALWRRRPRPGGPGDGAECALAGAAGFALFNFPLALASSAWLTAGLAAGAGRAPPEGASPVSAGARRVAAVAAALLAGASLWLAAGAALHGAGRHATALRLCPGDGAAARAEADRGVHGTPPALDDAEARLAGRLSLAPRDPWTWRDLAHLRAWHRPPSALPGAVTALRAALDGNPRWAPWELELSRLLERSGDLPGAEAAARRALDLEPDYASADRQLCRLLRRRGDPGEAARRLRALLDRPLPSAGGTFPYQDEVLALDPAAVRAELAAAVRESRGGRAEALPAAGAEPVR
jgi:O-antigen ligase